MPRKGVPGIDGCLCEIKEKLKALYDRTHACILRINGKTPDGNGDITLDLSDAIPGRYVESVNGQDGNVIIDKASVGLSNVDNVSSSQILNQADANNQSRLDAFEAAKLDPVELEVTANSGRIIQLEGQQVVLDDKMEQTIQYVDAIGDDVAEIKDAYVDKTTTQYITGKKYGPTPTSADYSGMWVNKDFVETTDPAKRQNNLVHTISNESVNGVKSFVDGIRNKYLLAKATSTGWIKIYQTTRQSGAPQLVLLFSPVKPFMYPNKGGILTVQHSSDNSLTWNFCHPSNVLDNYRIAQNGNITELWIRIENKDNDQYYIQCLNDSNWDSINSWEAVTMTSAVSFPYESYISSTRWPL